MGLGGKKNESVDSIYLAEDKVKWRNVLNTLINLRVSGTTRNLLTSLGGVYSDFSLLISSIESSILVRSEVLTAASVMKVVFWFVAPCRLVEVYQTYFSETLVNFCQARRRYNPEDGHLRIRYLSYERLYSNSDNGWFAVQQRCITSSYLTSNEAGENM
jgi:hypothetical protein